MKRTTIAAILGSTALLAPGAVEADHRPGHNPGGSQGTGVTIKATSPIKWGRSTEITGKVSGSERSGALVDLEADEFPYADAEFQKVASVTTDNNGDYRFVAKPTAHTRYRAVAKTTPPMTSAVANVLVRIRVKLAVSDSTPRRGARVRFSGTACPEHADRVANIQKRSRSGSFSTVSRTTLEDAGDCSEYAKRVRVRSDGVYRVTVLSKDGDHSTGISRRISIDTHR